jgi:hypothetical protein
LLKKGGADHPKSTVVSDIDGTILLTTKAATLLWRLSRLFETLGRLYQRPNQRVLQRIHTARKVLILTSRDATESALTLRQLRRAGLDNPKVVFCRRETLYFDWKLKVLSELNDSEGLVWIDDAIGTQGERDLIRELGSRVEPIDPSSLK